jgi:cyclopropane-fatty-acyl-phospholipid synthase
MTALALARPREALRASAPLPLRLLLAAATQCRRGAIELQAPDGGRFRIEGDAPGPRASVRFHRVRAARRLLSNGGVGWGEAYMDGDWDSPELADLLAWAATNEDVFTQRLLDGRPWLKAMRRIGHLLRPNTREGSRRNIARHYDLGNDFYARWLDAGMTYSSAIYAEGDDSIERAQDRKYERLARLIGLEPGHEVLEIGCGWGGFASWAAREVGARVTAITVSSRQRDHAAERIRREGLAERVEVRLQDYRETSGAFDRIVSIEMLEAVGEKFWPIYFQTLAARLKPGGRAGLQVITMADRLFDGYRRSADFIQCHIFPGGMLPPPAALRREAATAGLAWLAAADYGAHYARTLLEWRGRFLAAWDDIHGPGFDERFRRMWEYYLAYCEAGFRVGWIDVKQLALQKGA